MHGRGVVGSRPPTRERYRGRAIGPGHGMIATGRAKGPAFPDGPPRRVRPRAPAGLSRAYPWVRLGIDSGRPLKALARRRSRFRREHGEVSPGRRRGMVRSDRVFEPDRSPARGLGGPSAPAPRAVESSAAAARSARPVAGRAGRLVDREPGTGRTRRSPSRRSPGPSPRLPHNRTRSPTASDRATCGSVFVGSNARQGIRSPVGSSRSNRTCPPGPAWGMDATVPSTIAERNGAISVPDRATR